MSLADQKRTKKMKKTTTLIILLFSQLIQLSQAQDDCKPRKCNAGGPTVRFPFRLKTHQPDHCGHHRNFDLSCSPNKDTLLQLPSNVTVVVTAIDYESQSIYFRDPDGCFPKQIRALDLSRSVFKFSESVYSFTLFSCTPRDRNVYLTCLRDANQKVYAVQSQYSLDYIPLLFCRKMYNVSSAPSEAFFHTDLRLKWPQEICGSCEAQGQYCGWKNNGTSSKEFRCFGDLNLPDKDKWKRQLLTAIVVIGSFLLVALVVTLFWMRRLKITKKENRAKINLFLQDYLALKPARYSYADIKKITSDLQDEIGQGSYGTVYKGKLSSDVYVAVKILNNSKGHEDNEFINEVGIISKIHHVNVVRLVGYCADGFRRALIYEFLQNDSLEKYVSSDENKASLGWKKMHNIAVNIARGIEYLHQGCDQQILHFDIKPHNILLDQNLNPKISDFGLAKLCSKDQSAVSMTTARGTIGYIAPEVFSRNFGNVSYKSDIYSFGMLLLELVGGRRSSEEVSEDTTQVYFPEWVYSRLEHGEELGIQIQDNEDAAIAKKLAVVGLWCVQWYPGDRPSMSGVIQMLESEASLIMPPNPFSSTTGTSGGGSLKSELQIIVESE